MKTIPLIKWPKKRKILKNAKLCKYHQNLGLGNKLIFYVKIWTLVYLYAENYDKWEK